MRTVNVPLGDRAYPIRIGPGLLAGLGTHCARLKCSPRCAVITDDRVARHYHRPVVQSLRAAGFQPAVITLKAGEKTKTLKTAEACHEQLAAPKASLL